MSVTAPTLKVKLSERRVFVPGDVFVAIVGSIYKISDGQLAAAKALNETGTNDPGICKPLLNAVVEMGNVIEFLKAIVEEQGLGTGTPTPPTPATPAAAA